MGRFSLTNWQSAARGGLLPLAILILVILMIVPVPAFLLDIGFIANIIIALAVLMVALNAAKPLDFSAFFSLSLYFLESLKLSGSTERSLASISANEWRSTNSGIRC